MKVARERKTSVLASNTAHYRVDSLTGIVTLFAILSRLKVLAEKILENRL